MNTSRPYLTIDQVCEKLFGGPSPLRLRRNPAERSGRNKSAKAERRAEIQERRKVIRAAFLLVRYDPTEAAIKKQLLAALGGKAEVTETLVDGARQIIADRPVQSNVTER